MKEILEQLTLDSLIQPVLIYTIEYGGRSIEVFIFVGLEAPLQEIPAGALVRVSLARWLNVAGEDRCYLQISGWYL